MTKDVVQGITRSIILALLAASLLPHEADSLIAKGSLRLEGQVADVVVAGDRGYLATRLGNGGGGLQVIDILNPIHPYPIGSLETGDAQGLELVGTIAYVAGLGVTMIDVTNPAVPVKLGAFVGSCAVHDVAVAGTIVYAACFVDGLKVIDFSDPLTPIEIGAIDTPGSFGNGAVAVELVDRIAYVADSSFGLLAIDVSSPQAPKLLGSIGGPAVDLEIVGTLAYVAAGGFGLSVIDISDPRNLRHVGVVDTPGAALDVSIVGNRAYVADSHWGFRVIDVSEPSAPQLLAHLGVTGFATAVAVVGSFAWVGGADLPYYDEGRLDVIDVSVPDFPIEVGRLENLDLESISDIDVHNDVAYLASSHSGLRVVNVSDVTQPTEIGEFDTPGIATACEVIDDIAYVTDGPSGFRLIDVSNPRVPVQLGAIAAEGWASALDVEQGVAFVQDLTEEESAVRIIDVSNPTHPSELGAFAATRTALDVEVVGDLAYVVDGEGFRVLDVSAPTAPRQIGSAPLGGNAIEVASSIAYVAAQPWLGAVDVSDPTQPLLIGDLYFSSSSFTDIVADESKELIYAVGGSGYSGQDWPQSVVRVIRTSDPGSLVEIGAFNLPRGSSAVDLGQNGLVHVGSYGLRIIDFGPEYVSLPSADPACDDELDNDGDGVSDYPEDPGCERASDGSERSDRLVCDDGLDNDADGSEDFPADHGCGDPEDASERSGFACDDGLDNDNDGATDGVDPGCAGIDDVSELLDTACEDGVDNDGDGRTDYPLDPGCLSAGDGSEYADCEESNFLCGRRVAFVGWHQIRVKHVGKVKEVTALTITFDATSWSASDDHGRPYSGTYQIVDLRRRTAELLFLPSGQELVARIAQGLPGNPALEPSGAATATVEIKSQGTTANLAATWAVSGDQGQGGSYRLKLRGF